MSGPSWRSSSAWLSVMHSDAIIDGPYRYWLLRRWLRVVGAPRVLWIMLNPSTADASIDDPTIKRVISFSHSWGCGSAAVVNLFGLRSTEPAGLYTAADPIGPLNDAAIIAGLLAADMVVCAWGTHGPFAARDKAVMRLLAAHWRHPVYCLGITKDGCPKHPLYIKADAPLVRFNVE